MCGTFKTSKIVSRFKKLLSNDAGNTAQILALAAVPLLITLGSAVDTVRMGRERTAFLGAVDSAALALASDGRSVITGNATIDAANLAALKTVATNYLKANYKVGAGETDDLSVDLAMTNQKITMTAHHSYPTAFMGLVGINTLDVSSTSVIGKAARPMELVIVMDNTGSMSWAADGGSASATKPSKMKGAIDAATKLLGSLYGDTPGIAGNIESPFIRVSLVPFTTSVRLNPSAYDFDLNWIDTSGANPLSKLHFNNSSWNNYMAWSKMKDKNGNYMTWNGCVEERAAGSSSAGTDYNQNDAAPDSSNPATLFPAYFAPDGPTNLGYGGSITNNSYIGTSTTPNENTGLTTTQKNSTTPEGYLYKERNQAKYDGFKFSVTPSPSTAGPWVNCVALPIVPMTYKRDTVQAGIDAMVAGGSTEIAEGLAWGMRVISPGAPFTKVEPSANYGGTSETQYIAPYNDTKWRKVMVMMTDGQNDLSPTSSFDGVQYSAYGRSKETAPGMNRFGTTVDGDTEEALDTIGQAICDKMKANNVEIYTVAFGGGVSASSQTNVANCATDAAHFKNASDNVALMAFFDSIGQTLNKNIFVSQ